MIAKKSDMFEAGKQSTYRQREKGSLNEFDSQFKSKNIGHNYLVVARDMIIEGHVWETTSLSYEQLS